MPIVKVIEVISSSEKGFEDATMNALIEASRTIKNIRSIYIKEMNAKVENNQIVSYGVNAKISFEIDHSAKQTE
jgi:flavin-binding protein dodecin